MGTLSDRFVMPPFSVLDARQGYWQERKRFWLAKGIKSELGRGDCDPAGSIRPAADYSKRERGDGAGKALEDGGGGHSIFDPVLCELIYRWFAPPGGHVLDPFAGGSVRGIVAALTGFQYTGVDLRPEQIAANVVQGDQIVEDGPAPRWIAGDSQDIAAIAPGRYDLIFSCPPYFDLERYSDDPRDLSTMDYEGFLKTYRGIVAASVGMLKPDRFACFVVGDIRDRRGFYRNFVGDTIEAFQDAGAILYNEAVLITSVGSLPIRVNKQFQGYRKLGKTHQNVLVFYKGDPKNIKSIYGDVDTGLKNHEQESLFSFEAPATLEDFE